MLAELVKSEAARNREAYARAAAVATEAAAQAMAMGEQGIAMMRRALALVEHVAANDAEVREQLNGLRSDMEQLIAAALVDGLRRQETDHSNGAVVPFTRRN
jgi:hypothetical protein